MVHRTVPAAKGMNRKWGTLVKMKFQRGTVYVRGTKPQIFSLRDVEELLEERGLNVDHTTVWRWVQYFGPELEQRLRRHLKPTNKSWRVDETYVRVKGRWCYLY